MNSLVLVAIGFTAFFLGYKFYSKYISFNLFEINKSISTPSESMRDGIDYYPTKKHILFGHHFTSIAGAAPIIGPCVAAYWGWLPAILWILIGTIFIGAVHDLGALVVSVKEDGRSIADIASTVISKRVRLMFLIFVLMLVWLVLAVFAMAIADLFVSVPTSVIPINVQIIIALAVGVLLNKKNMNTLLLSLGSVILLYFFIWVGSNNPVVLSHSASIVELKNYWIVLLFIYSAIASLVPVWVLLQPRDYINSHQLFIGLILLFLGVIIAQPTVSAPAIRPLSDPSTPGLFPLLFVTIACGAISGFHGLVASGTTSKQLEYISDARMIGYGGMLGEGTLALISTIAAVAGISLVGHANLPSNGYIADLDWSQYYASWEHASGNKAAAFVLGGGALLMSLGIPESFANTLMAVFVISFAATTLDTATRIQRFILGEFGKAVKVNFLTNKYLATLIAVVPALFLAFWNVEDPTSGTSRQAGWILWPIFGASNQMLAALTLMVLTLYFWKRRKPVLPLLIPMVALTIITFSALIVNAISFYGTNDTLFILTIMLIILIVWMLFEGLIRVFRVNRTL
jgi:carbon starvation protein